MDIEKWCMSNGVGCVRHVKFYRMSGKKLNGKDLFASIRELFAVLKILAHIRLYTKRYFVRKLLTIRQYFFNALAVVCLVKSNKNVYAMVTTVTWF